MSVGGGVDDYLGCLIFGMIRFIAVVMAKFL
jgi:hypothetical protein